MIADRLPTAAEHEALARSVGWLDHFDYASMPASLAGSLRGSVVLVDDEVVGMARLVGDGVHYFYLQDVIVRPDHDGNGYATQLVQRLLHWVAAVAPAPAVVGLFASPEARGVYDDLGFTAGDATGMTISVDPAP
jgi:GNAT superfamily N-acetyltransferase